ncbi:hypothetical protein HQ571_05085 [Candidatus Kuenenbacteria bacterium]|nr:hypothetical protein [Candidatus Kuenenbacteria bacterium]
MDKRSREEWQRNVMSRVSSQAIIEAVEQPPTCAQDFIDDLHKYDQLSIEDVAAITRLKISFSEKTLDLLKNLVDNLDQLSRGIHGNRFTGFMLGLIEDVLYGTVTMNHPDLNEIANSLLEKILLDHFVSVDSYLDNSFQKRASAAVKAFCSTHRMYTNNHQKLYDFLRAVRKKGQELIDAVAQDDPHCHSSLGPFTLMGEYIIIKNMSFVLLQPKKGCELLDMVLA